MQYPQNGRDWTTETERLQQQIWDAFEEHEDELDEQALMAVTDQADPAAIQAALRVLEQDGRIDYSDGVARKL